MNSNRKKSSYVDLEMIAAAEFEDTLNQTGFGLFSILMTLMGFLMAMSVIFATAAMSYIITAIDNDINLSLYQKGVVNSITYYGMITGGLFWAIIADTKGRRPVLIFTHALDALFMNLAALCHIINLIVLFKFCSGFCIAGGYTTFMIYLSEVHPKSKRSLMLFVVGLLLNTASIMLPILAMIILPNPWKINVFGLCYTNWQMYMNITTIAGLLVALAFFFLPESPKFDHAVGRVHRAHSTFQLIFAINKCKPRTDFPVMAPAEADSLMSLTIKGEIEEFIKSLTKTRYILPALMIFCIEFFIYMCQNTLRLWQPTLIASAEMLKDISELQLCCIIDYTVKLTHTHQNITVNATDTRLTWRHYKNNLFIHFLNYGALVSGIIMLTLLGPKRLLCLTMCVGCLFASLMYFVKSYWCIVLPALFLSVSHIAVISLINVAIYTFPTRVRATFLCLSVTLGRIGSAVGSMLFPHLMVAGCIPTIAWVLVSVIIPTIVSFCVPGSGYMP